MIRLIFGLLVAAMALGLADKSQAQQTPALASEKPTLERKLVRGESRLPDDYLVRIAGKVNVIDAHTLRFEDGTEIDLNGMMEAPDRGQMGSIDNQLYPAGAQAAEFLEKLIAGREVVCLIPTDRPDWAEQMKFRQGFAFVAEVSLNTELVRNGWAIAHHSGMAPYEALAREESRGLWRGTFIYPERWRRGDRLPGEEE